MTTLALSPRNARKPPSASRAPTPSSARAPAPASPLDRANAVLERPGAPMDAQARTFMESRFGRDFGGVRVHTDSDAARTAKDLGAVAYTVDRHVVFGGGAPDVGSPAGRAVWAHELAHVVQQGGDPARRDRLSPLAVGPVGDALEREADAASLRVVAGGRAEVRAGGAPSGVRRLQRLTEYGTYISKLTEPDLKPFLDNAEVYYRGWGYPNVQRISTMDEVLQDLDKSKGHIETFRIVTHAAPGHLQVGLTPAISNDSVSTKEMGLTTAASFRPLFTSKKLVNDMTFADELKALRADTTTGALLTQMGVGATNPARDEPLGIVLHAILDSDLVTSATLDDGSRLVLKNRAALNAFNSQRFQLYRDVVAAAAPQGQGPKVKQAIDSLMTAAPAVLRAANFNWSFDQATADTLGDDLLDPNAKTPTLNPELGAAVKEGADKGTFLPRLTRVRSKIDATTHVEIRGCNAGGDKSFLESMRSFFGPSPQQLPSISAPDLFQAYAKLGFDTYDQGVPADQQRLQDAWNDPSLGLPKAYDDAYRTRAGEMIRMVTFTKMSELPARYKLSQTEQDLKDLNPELKPDNLQPGEVVWLVGRKVPAGQNTTLEDFCQNVLGNKYLWPKIWGANPQWTKPPVLTPTDMVWIVPIAQQKRVASASRTLTDFQADLAKGNAFGMTTPGNQFKLQLDHPKRDTSVGSWVAKQGYDFRGRNAAELSKLFSGDFKKRFGPAMTGHAAQFLTRSFPIVEDPIFPDDPRYAAHIIRVP